MGPIARRSLILAAAALTLAACTKGGADVDISQDMSLGSADAKVTVIEYASPTCPHCAAWAHEVFPQFKAKYIDTGKVRYVLRETPVHGAADAAVFMLARCAGKDRYFNILDGAWNSLPGLNPNDPKPWVFQLGRSAGMSDQQIDACVTDKKALEAFNDRVEKQSAEFQVSSTPTFIVNGRKLPEQAPPSLEQISAAIDPLLK